MPLEYREISFSLEEVEKLIRTYEVKFELPFPDGLVLSAKIKHSAESNEKVLGMKIRVDKRTGKKTYHELPLRFISEYLLLYCEDHDIPLPIQAKKILRTQKNRLILRVNVGKTPAKLKAVEHSLF